MAKGNDTRYLKKDEVARQCLKRFSLLYESPTYLRLKLKVNAKKNPKDVKIEYENVMTEINQKITPWEYDSRDLG